jgi:hypothetical protein
MTTRYQQLWRGALRLRNDPREFTRAYLELQREIEREAKECLHVHAGIKMEGRSGD